MQYVYTKKAELRAKQLSLEERKEGTTAMYGYKPLEGGPIANAWLAKGYIRKADEDNRR